jgi:hypothetical protein
MHRPWGAYGVAIGDYGFTISGYEVTMGWLWWLWESTTYIRGGGSTNPYI